MVYSIDSMHLNYYQFSPMQGIKKLLAVFLVLILKANLYCRTSLERGDS